MDTMDFPARKTTGHGREKKIESRSAAGPTVWNRFVFDPAASIPPEQPIYDGLLAKGDLAIWLGREKHRKSTVLLQFAICAAVGRVFLHFPFRPSHALKVVLLDYESKSQTLKNRYDAVTEAMKLSLGEGGLLKSNLCIIEMRKAFRHGLKFARFPVQSDLEDAETVWRSFVRETTADLYIIDPMRCMHAQGENDSTIEALLTRIHQVFGDAGVVISHHLRKRTRKLSDQISLKGDMRVWADEARGSGAITAHADVIVCQEREVENGVELLHLGAYLRDGADIEPMVLRETCSESFLWQVAPDIPLELMLCLDELRNAGGSFQNRTAAVAILQQSLGSGRSTGFTRLNDLIKRGLLVERDGLVKLAETLDEAGKSK
jgi:AAA domain